ncbi:hypothetical protein BDV36DRAFT_271301 [Aspergillus pseudocaelatus]|uniref:Uncharacterized protein n=1 Tax=Aspergillus pseudocaelatus TaxID=1825620 RepID=A0ABQ6W5X8_9EURO|nr:hypothetical protein BDV36DRAFT_271301 [Aspergillus pseudocaelatus]
MLMAANNGICKQEWSRGAVLDSPEVGFMRVSSDLASRGKQPTRLYTAIKEGRGGGGLRQIRKRRATKVKREMRQH